MCDIAQSKVILESQKNNFDPSANEIWKMSLGRAGEEEDIFDYCIKNDCVLLGWGNDINFSNATNRKQVEEIMDENGYEDYQPWTELILSEYMPVSAQGNWRGMSLLFPMEKLFEHYVAYHLCRSLKDWKVKTQVSSQHKLTKITKHAKRYFWLNDVCICHGSLPSHSA